MNTDFLPATTPEDFNREKVNPSSLIPALILCSLLDVSIMQRTKIRYLYSGSAPELNTHIHENRSRSHSQYMELSRGGKYYPRALKKPNKFLLTFLSVNN